MGGDIISVVFQKVCQHLFLPQSGTYFFIPLNDFYHLTPPTLPLLAHFNFFYQKWLGISLLFEKKHGKYCYRKLANFLQQA